MTLFIIFLVIVGILALFTYRNSLSAVLTIVGIIIGISVILTLVS